MNTKVFSPIMQSSLPAQVVSDGLLDLTIPFEVPSLVNIKDVRHMQVAMINQVTNKYVGLVSYDFEQAPDYIYYTKKFQGNHISFPLDIGIKESFDTNEEFNKAGLTTNGAASMLKWDSALQCAKMVDRWNQWSAPCYQFAFSSNTEYYISVKIYHQAATADSFYLSIGYRSEENPGKDPETLQSAAKIETKVQPYVWTKISGTISLADLENKDYYLNIMNKTEGFDFYFDDLTIMPVNFTTATEFSQGLYKIQTRFGYCDLWTTKNPFVPWKQEAIEAGDFSEWSTVCMLKLISQPSLDITNTSPVLSLQPTWEAYAQFAAEDEEYVDKYKFQISGGGLELDSGWQQHKANTINDTFTFDEIIPKGEYTVTYSIISTNGYQTSVSEKMTVVLNTFGTPENVEVAVTGDEENGCVHLALSLPQTDLGKVFRIARRASFEENWEELYRFTATNQNVNYNDFTIESGVTYTYGLQIVSDNGYSELKLTDDITIYFDHAYLVGDGGRQLKMKYDFKINSFKRTVLASKQDTLGSKYPTILRNGVARYAEFPISGLITFNMDEEGYFDTSSSVDFSWSGLNNLTHDNRFNEKKFRDKVEAFLNDGKYKLFRSATEGNFIVTLMNVSLTPNATLGRMIYSFSATAYEIAECTVDNMRMLNIIQPNNITEDARATLLGKTLTSLDGDLWTTVAGNLGEHQVLESISDIRIATGSADVTMVLSDGSQIIIPKDSIYKYPNTMTSSADTLSIKGEGYYIDYTYTVSIDLPEYEYEVVSIWGQLSQEHTGFLDVRQQIVAKAFNLNLEDKVTILGPGELSFTSPDMAYWEYSDGDDFIDIYLTAAGRKFNVSWDGVVYQCATQKSESYGYCLGNLSLIEHTDNVVDTGEPFCIASDYPRLWFTTSESILGKTITVEIFEERESEYIAEDYSCDFKQLEFYAPIGTSVVLNGQSIVIGDTNRYIAPAGTYSSVTIAPASDNLTLVDYYCTILKQTEKTSEGGE